MKILAFGEILWDEFLSADGNLTHKKIGGAPFNFAAHCAKNGAESYIMTALGEDENGRDALSEVKRLGIGSDYISLLPQYPTGACRVTLKDGMPSYELMTDVAYDHIPQAQIKTDFDALYMGTLAMRCEDSENSFNSLVNSVSAKEVLFDVNFRGDFYNEQRVYNLLSHATILKISHEEIGFFGKDGHKEVCRSISQGFPKLKYICLTLGKDGAMIFDCKNHVFYTSPKPKSKAVSTVGAGDSFAAAFLTGLLSGLSAEDCLERAVALSDFVVTRTEAIPDYDPEILYNRL